MPQHYHPLEHLLPLFILSEAQHGDLGLIQKNDVLILISNSGKTREIIEFLELANKLYNNLIVAALTGDLKSTCKISDEYLFTGNPKEICPLGLTPTTSTTVMTVVGDILVVSMMNKINFSKKIMPKTSQWIFREKARK